MHGTATASSASTYEDDVAAAAHEHHDQSLPKTDFPKFVRFFRQASPYIEGHRGRTFVIVVPGEVGRRPWTCHMPVGIRGGCLVPGRWMGGCAAYAHDLGG